MPSTVSDRLISIFSRQPLGKGHRAKDGNGKHDKLTPEKLADLKNQARTRPLKQLNILKKARTRVEKGWVAHEIATDANGNPVEPDSPEACEWCLSGALQAAAYEYGNPKAAATHRRIDEAARTILYANLGKKGFQKVNAVITLANLNDNIITNKDEALEYLDNAIAAQTAYCREKGLL